MGFGQERLLNALHYTLKWYIYNKDQKEIKSMWITSGNNKYRISTFSVAKFPMKTKKIFRKTRKFWSITWNFNNAFKPTLDQKSSRIKTFNALSLFILLCGNKIWTPRKKDINRDEIFQKNNGE
jgi:hypothetical protein